MTGTDPILEARSLTKSFGDFVAVKNVTFSLKKGEILGLLGANGAGKTTTMRMLTGAVWPTDGEVLLNGKPIRGAGSDARQKIGYLPEGVPLYTEMTVREYLYFIADCYQIEKSKRRDRVENSAAAVNLTEVMDQSIDTLSKGFSRRVGLAGAILHSPDVLVLDEPTDGLDPNQKFEIRKLIESLSLDRGIIISTHILEEVEAFCTRTIVVNDGQVVVDALPTELKSMSKYEGAVTLLVETDAAEKIAASLSQMRIIDSIDAAKEGDGMRLTIYAKGGEEIASRIKDMASISRWPISEFTVENGKLEDVFRTLTTNDPSFMREAAKAFLQQRRENAS